jgi:chemotaxis protein methyltransferase CheR
VIERSEALDNLDFESFKRKVRTAYGIDLNAYKRQQMERRLRAIMSKCGAATFQQYYKAIEADETLLDEFLDRLTINVSEFFRNPEQFDTLGKTVLPLLLANRTSELSIWSAGCSYGAEPYTLAVMLEELSPQIRHRITATDIDDRMLQRARSGLFQESELRNVAKHRLLKYFGSQPDGFMAKDVLKSKITFKKHNLLEDRFDKGFDLILCRNVVIYFTEETKHKLYERFYDSLRPGGWLFVGGTERISDSEGLGFENRMPFFYSKPRAN